MEKTETLQIDGCKVFSATLARDRDSLGETVTTWINEHKSRVELTNYEVRQSSDKEFHCLSIILFYRNK